MSVYFGSRARMLVAGAILLAGCAGPSERSDAPSTERRATVSTDCFTVSQARDYRYLDDRNLIVFAPARRAFHLELSSVCTGLRGEFSIGLRARSDRMCGFAGDAVITDSGFPDRCPVLRIRRLDADELEALLAQFEPGERLEDAVEVEVPPAEEEAEERATETEDEAVQ